VSYEVYVMNLTSHQISFTCRLIRLNNYLVSVGWMITCTYEISWNDSSISKNKIKNKNPKYDDHSSRMILRSRAMYCMGL
jgi:hypothetical protein